jgi:ABC transporter transmembrane region
MYEDASQVANDAVSGIRTVASFCVEQKVIEAYTEKCDEPMKQGIRAGLVGGLGYGLSFLLFHFSYALCFYVGAKLVHNGEATFTEVFRVSIYYIGALLFVSFPKEHSFFIRFLPEYDVLFFSVLIIFEGFLRSGSIYNWRCKNQCNWV